jgi:hypothetical protein
MAFTVERESEALYELTMGVAEGRIDKAAAALEQSRVAGEAREPGSLV